MREQARDQMSGPVTLDYLQARLSEGWRVLAIEWERGAEQTAEPSATAPVRSEPSEEVP